MKVKLGDLGSAFIRYAPIFKMYTDIKVVLFVDTTWSDITNFRTLYFLTVYYSMFISK